MKKILSLLLILMIGFGGYLLYDKYFSNRIPKLNTEEEKVNINSLYIYGTHLNLGGTLVNDDNLDLVLYNGEFMNYDIKTKDNGFVLSDYINSGLYLEDIPEGKYYAFLRSTNTNENNRVENKYYVLNNVTDYPETIYYTFSNNNRKIVINTDDYYNTLMFSVTKNDDPEIYDIVIDPGHGGMDSGARSNGRREDEYTMKIAENLKTKLEKYGIKVKLTRTKNQLGTNDLLNDYGEHGRAVVGHEVGAKYVFSIHLNSSSASSVNGLEIYTASKINYDFVSNLANNIVTATGTNYSTNKINRIKSGIYSRNFTEEDIAISKKESKEKNKEAYDITTDSVYYFMIRETGGIMTGAYVDNRNAPKYPENPYYDSNIGSEAYLFELGYLTSTTDMNRIDNKMDNYTEAIANSFKEIFEKNDKNSK